MPLVQKHGKIIEVPDSEFAVDTAQAADFNASQMRSQRDSLLSQTDWRFRSDMTTSQAWIDYCQALRDIPQQVGFPENVVWPAEPVK